MTDQEKIAELQACLLAVRAISRKTAEPEGLLRKIDQTVGFGLQRTGLEASEICAAVVADAYQAERHYLVNLGNVQLEGRLGEDGMIAGRRVWFNDEEILCEGLEISLPDGGPARANLLGVNCHDRGGQTEGPDHDQAAAGG